MIRIKTVEHRLRWQPLCNTYHPLVHLLIDATELLQLDGATSVGIMLQEQLIADLHRQLKAELLESDTKSVHIHSVPSFAIRTQRIPSGRCALKGKRHRIRRCRGACSASVHGIVWKRRWSIGWRSCTRIRTLGIPRRWALLRIHRGSLDPGTWRRHRIVHRSCLRSIDYRLLCSCTSTLRLSLAIRTLLLNNSDCSYHKRSHRSVDIQQLLTERTIDNHIKNNGRDYRLRDQLSTN